MVPLLLQVHAVRALGGRDGPPCLSRLNPRLATYASPLPSTTARRHVAAVVPAALPAALAGGEPRGSARAHAARRVHLLIVLSAVFTTHRKSVTMVMDIPLTTEPPRMGSTAVPR